MRISRHWICITCIKRKYASEIETVESLKIRRVTGSDTLNERTTVTFTTRNQVFRFKAYLYETTHDILLGNDFLRKFTPKLDYFQKKIVFENATIPFNLSKEEMKGRTLKRQTPLRLRQT